MHHSLFLLFQIVSVCLRKIIFRIIKIKIKETKAVIGTITGTACVPSDIHEALDRRARTRSTQDILEGIFVIQPMIFSTVCSTCSRSPVSSAFGTVKVTFRHSQSLSRVCTSLRVISCSTGPGRSPTLVKPRMTLFLRCLGSSSR